MASEMDMVERVRRAIEAAMPAYLAEDGAPDDLLAREAIKAMRELTREMLMASGFGRTQNAKWQAMVDQALGKHPAALSPSPAPAEA